MRDFCHGARFSVFACSFSSQPSTNLEVMRTNLENVQRLWVGRAFERIDAAPFASVCRKNRSKLGIYSDSALIAGALSASASVARQEESTVELEMLEPCLLGVNQSECDKDEEELTDDTLEDDLFRSFLNSRVGALDRCDGRLLTEKTEHPVLNQNFILRKDSSQNTLMQKILTGKSSGDEVANRAGRTNRPFTKKGSEYTDEVSLEKEYALPSTAEDFSVDEHDYLLTNIERLLADNQLLEEHLDIFSKDINTASGNLVMRMLGEKHLTLQALSVFQWMKSQDPCRLNSISYSIIFKYLGQEGLPEKALVLFKNMPEAENCHCINVYNSLLGALLNCGRSHEALELLKQFESRGIKPDAVTFSLLITAARKGRYGLEGAWSLFRLLIKNLDDTSNIFACGTLIKALCDKGLHKEGLLLAVEMEKSGIPLNVVIYNTLIDAYGKSQELEESEGLFTEMVNKGLHPNESTYNALINAYGRVGQFEVGEALLKEMYELNLKPNVITYTSLMSAYGKQKLSLKAVDVFLRMKNSGIAPNTHAYTVLINAYSEGGWHEKSAMAFEDMKKEGLTPTVENYTALLDGFRQAGAVERVKEIWKEMRQSGVLSTRITFNVLVDSFAKQGLYEDVRDVIHEFGKLGLKPDKMTYNMLINAYARGGRHEQAQSIIKEMRVAGFKPDSYTFSTLIYAFLRVRDFKVALRYHDEMCKAKQMPDLKSYRKMKAILEEKLARKLDNDYRANQGQLWKSKKRKKKSFRKNKPA